MISGHPFRKRALNVLDENGNEGCAQCGHPPQAHSDRKTVMDGPLTGVHEHQPELVDDLMRCALCGQRVRSLRFGVWLIWVSLESGQVCQGAGQ